MFIFHWVVVFILQILLLILKTYNENKLLYCVTSFTKCCRHNETGTSKSSGLWKFPNGSNVTSRTNKTEGIWRTRSLSSDILHRLTNESSPTGVYTCEILDDAGNMIKLLAHLYFGGTLPGTVWQFYYQQVELNYFCTNILNPIC